MLTSQRFKILKDAAFPLSFFLSGFRLRLCLRRRRVSPRRRAQRSTRHDETTNTKVRTTTDQRAAPWSACLPTCLPARLRQPPTCLPDSYTVMAATPALPGLLCCITALILLIFATISTPIWNDIFFLEVTANGATTRFGAFGYTGSPKQLGYYIDSAALGFTYVLPAVTSHPSRTLTRTHTGTPTPAPAPAQHAHIPPVLMVSTQLLSTT